VTYCRVLLMSLGSIEIRHSLGIPTGLLTDDPGREITAECT
jgi:hypothetical protein